MPEYGRHELIVIAALITLALAWLKLMRQKGDPRLIAACGLLAYFLPIAGPLAALLMLNLYDRRRRGQARLATAAMLAAAPVLTPAREGA